MSRFGLVVILVTACSVTMASDYKQLSGSYRIGGQSLYDPPETEPQDTHLYVELTGAAAKDLYDRMPVAPVADECVDDGAKTKTIGEMRCTRPGKGKQHTCWFGIDIQKQRITNGVTC